MFHFLELYPLTFHFLGIELHGFSIYNTSGLMTRVTSLKKVKEVIILFLGLFSFLILSFDIIFKKK